MDYCHHFNFSYLRGGGGRLEVKPYSFSVTEYEFSKLTTKEQAADLIPSLQVKLDILKGL
jgi:hypothetical protein